MPQEQTWAQRRREVTHPSFLRRFNVVETPDAAEQLGEAFALGASAKLPEYSHELPNFVIKDRRWSKPQRRLLKEFGSTILHAAELLHGPTNLSLSDLLRVDRLQALATLMPHMVDTEAGAGNKSFSKQEIKDFYFRRVGGLDHQKLEATARVADNVIGKRAYSQTDLQTLRKALKAHAVPKIQRRPVLTPEQVLAVNGIHLHDAHRLVRFEFAPHQEYLASLAGYVDSLMQRKPRSRA